MHCTSASTFNSATARQAYCLDLFAFRTTQEVMGRFSRNLGNHRRVDQILEDWGSASVNLPLHHKVQKFSSGTGSPGSSRKKGRKTVVVVWWGPAHLPLDSEDTVVEVLLSAEMEPGLRVTGHRFWPGRVRSRVSLSDPVFDPVLSFNMHTYRGVVSTE